MEIIRSFTKTLTARLANPINFIQVVVGPRQVGKSTGIAQFQRTFSGPIHHATADQMVPPDGAWVREQWLRARALGSGAVLIIDEIQKVPRWSEIVKILFDEDRGTRDLRVVLLGSSSLTLQHGLTESLAGRFELIKVPHWSFTEHHRAFGLTFEQFLQMGGYPAFSSQEWVEDSVRWQSAIRDSVIEPVISRDIMSQVTISKPALFRQTFELAVSSPAQVVAFKKLLGQLQETGNATTIKNYLEIFERSFLIKLVGRYSGSRLRQRTSSPKIIPLAPALSHAFGDPLRVHHNREWKGQIVESIVGAHISRGRGQLFYWQENDYEVDFILELNNRTFAIEVKSGKPRRAKSIGAFLKKYPNVTPITFHEENIQQFLSQEDPDSFFLAHS